MNERRGKERQLRGVGRDDQRHFPRRTFLLEGGQRQMFDIERQ